MRRTYCSLKIQSARGFNLVELLIAMVLGLLITGSLITLYSDLTYNSGEMRKITQQIEGGRFAVQLLQKNLTHAGFWDGYVPQYDDFTFQGVPTDVPAAIPDPCLAYSVANWTDAYKNSLITLPVQVYEDIPASCSPGPTYKLANTDVLVVRHLETCIPGVGACAAVSAGELLFQASRCASEGAYDYVLGIQGTDTFDLTQRDCATLATVRRFTSTIYYVRDYAITIGDGIPTLMRSQLSVSGGVLEHQTPVALVEGVESFKVELGVDSIGDGGVMSDYSVGIGWVDADTPSNRGDGAADGAFIRCTTAVPCTVAQLMDAVVLKVYLLVRTVDDTVGYTSNKTYSLGSTGLGPYNDNFKRHVYASTIRLTNISNRRETP
jgi:type IV pilus assembly protein PilW